VSELTWAPGQAHGLGGRGRARKARAQGGGGERRSAAPTCARQRAGVGCRCRIHHPLHERGHARGVQHLGGSQAAQEAQLQARAVVVGGLCGRGQATGGAGGVREEGRTHAHACTHTCTCTRMHAHMCTSAHARALTHTHRHMPAG